MISCEKENSAPGPEIPDWLKDRIAQDEEVLKTNPQSVLSITAWISYYYAGNYYFENHNLLSSAWPETFNYEGTLINHNQESSLNYWTNKCCKQYIWKGPSYFEL